MKQLWTGRLEGGLDSKADALNASLSVDRRLAAQDVRGSIAWAHALQRAGLLTPGEAKTIEQGLAQIGQELASERFVIRPDRRRHPHRGGTAAG